MDFRTLSMVVTLAETLNFRATSKLHHVTPSTLSRIIQRTEEELDCVLFVRSNKSVTLTEYGQKVVTFAKESLQQFDDLKHQLHDNSPQSIHGSITIDCTVAIAYGVLPDMIKPFITQYPQITTHISTGSPDRSMQRLINNEVDFTIQAYHKPPKKPIIHQIVDCSQLIVVCPNAHDLPQSFHDLKDKPIVMSKYPALSTLVDALFKDHHITPQIHSYIDGHEAVLAMVAAGVGYAILPEIVLNNSHLEDQVTIAPFSDTLPSIQAAIFNKAQSHDSSAKRTFWNYVLTSYNSGVSSTLDIKE